MVSCLGTFQGPKLILKKMWSVSSKKDGGSKKGFPDVFSGCDLTDEGFFFWQKKILKCQASQNMPKFWLKHAGSSNKTVPFNPHHILGYFGIF